MVSIICTSIFLGREVTGARWLDSDEELRVLSNDGGELATLDCTDYPYGTNTVVRVAELDA